MSGYHSISNLSFGLTQVTRETYRDVPWDSEYRPISFTSAKIKKTQIISNIVRLKKSKKI
ncbi:hypothetical protein PL9214500422 [Planktothrix tepida PCC 9214]|uniref:Uncharacterized protein n=1 Tax=Planktothrix tepida PCC 9214 TaxID=671072 RepID=A0A1J1LL20_9CYAN|nr:hypothetical protein PL9214500422 [Planktothrix tepida PCC 9214]